MHLLNELTFFCLLKRFMLSLETDLTIRAKTTEMSVKDFSSGSYGTIFKNEVSVFLFLLSHRFAD